jgi:ATP-dependent DNA helicase RecG
MTLEELQELRERFDFEAKAAAGRDGKGTLPQSFWETYSAFANTEGGLIALGVKEVKGKPLDVRGVPEPERLQIELWNGLNNPKNISHNLLTNTDVSLLTLDNQLTVVLVRVPRARRQDRPVYVGTNPMTGTYRRQHEGDYICPDAVVKRMMSEAQNDTLDDRPLLGYGLADLSLDTLRAYRTEFAVRRPGHLWNGYTDDEFLECIGGWYRDRATGQSCLTLAGLLMFGQQHTIVQQVPYYGPDYQEQAPGAPRWVDRVTPDAGWSGNIFDFYRRVYPKLTADLKVPFQLVDDRRVDETDVHKALREALVNTLVHADYNGSIPIRIVKSPGSFDFRNPGLLRIPADEIYRGGTSDCRNRRLQTMFQHVGAAEKAGTGFSAILQAWAEQSWLQPRLTEHETLEAVELKLRVTSFIPPQAMQELTKRYGDKFLQLDANERWAMVCAWHYETVTNDFLSKQTDLHSADLTKLLGRLVRAGLLEQKLAGRWTSYRLGKGEPVTTEVIISSNNFVKLGLFGVGRNNFRVTENIAEVANDIAEVSEDIAEDISDIAEVVNDISQVDQDRLLLIAEPMRVGQPRQASADSIILTLCTGRFLTANQLAELLKRNPNAVRSGYLTRLAATDRLELKHPDKPRSRYQAYRTKEV